MYIFVYTQINVKTVLLQAIQLSISTQFSLIEPIDWILSGATPPGQSGPESNGSKGVVCIPQISSIEGASPSDYFVSYQDTHWASLTNLQRSSRCIL